MREKAGRRAVSFFAAVLLFVTMAAGALAAIPERPENLYVLDNANVLSSETQREIVRENEKLFDRTGAEVVVVTVDFLDGKSIRDYSYELFESWEIGSSERNNGLLLVLSVAEDTYYAMPGYGIEDFLTGERLDALLNENLEEDFAAGQYDAGVRKFFGAAVDELEAYYQKGGAEPEDGGYGEDGWEDNGYFEESSFRSLLRIVVRVIGSVVVVILLVLLVSVLSSGGRRGPKGGSGGSGGFFRGLLLGRAIGRSYRRRPPFGGPPIGGPPFGGPRPPMGGSRPRSPFGGSRPGGFHHGGGASRGGGFSRGGSTRGGGAGRGR